MVVIVGQTPPSPQAPAPRAGAWRCEVLLGAVIGLALATAIVDMGPRPWPVPPPAWIVWLFFLVLPAICIVATVAIRIPGIRPVYRAGLGVILWGVLLWPAMALVGAPMRTCAITALCAATSFVVACYSGDEAQRKARRRFSSEVLGAGISGAVIAWVAGSLLGVGKLLRLALPPGVEPAWLPLLAQPDYLPATIGFVVAAMQAVFDQLRTPTP